MWVVHIWCSGNEIPLRKFTTDSFSNPLLTCDCYWSFHENSLCRNEWMLMQKSSCKQAQASDNLLTAWLHQESRTNKRTSASITHVMTRQCTQQVTTTTRFALVGLLLWSFTEARFSTHRLPQCKQPREKGGKKKLFYFLVAINRFLQGILAAPSNNQLSVVTDENKNYALSIYIQQSV